VGGDRPLRGPRDKRRVRRRRSASALAVALEFWQFFYGFASQCWGGRIADIQRPRSPEERLNCGILRNIDGGRDEVLRLEVNGCSPKEEHRNRCVLFFLFIPATQGRPYIHPAFQKYIFDTEQPPIILISAVGATGKTALAENLSRDIGLPLFDLAKHKPVGDNTLTGLLTSAFEVKQISAVLEGLSTGTFGVIIDGVDEGRSKTNEKAFEAFLDDIARLCSAESGPTFVMQDVRR